MYYDIYLYNMNINKCILGFVASFKSSLSFEVFERILLYYKEH